MKYQFEPKPLPPTRVWIRGFSNKIDPWKFLVYPLLIAIVIVLAFWQLAKGLDKMNAQRCKDWSAALKQNPRIYLYATDYEMCQQLGINLK